MAKAKQLPSGSWRVQVYAGKDATGKRQYLSFTALTKKEAEYQALQWQLHYKEVSRDSSAMTLAEAMEKYIQSKDGILSPSTIRGYESLRKNYLKGIMDLRLNRLTPQIIQQAINEEAKPYTDAKGKKRTRTPKTIRNIHGLLSAVLAEYYPSLTLHTTLPQKEVKEQKILEPDQIATLLAAVEGDLMEIPVLMGVWLCMRASEIMALTWDCINFEQKTLTIKEARVRDKNNNWVDKTTKTTGSTRTISVPDHILSKLETAKAISEGERVVTLTNQSLYGRLKTILKRNGLPDIRFHDLRHTCASLLLSNGIPMKQIQIWLGHSTFSTTADIYAHLDFSAQEQSAAAMNAMFQRKEVSAG